MLILRAKRDWLRKAVFLWLLSQLAGRRGGEGMLNPATLS